MARQEEIQRLLDELRGAVPELKGVLLALNEGLPVSHSFVNGADPQRIAAMAAAASGIGRRISESLGSGALSEISVTGSEGQIFVYSAGPKAVLLAMAPAGANSGLIHLEARQTAAHIGQLF